MKIAVIGAGNVGKTIFYDLQHVNMVSEIVLVDRKLERARAEVRDDLKIMAANGLKMREELGISRNHQKCGSRRGHAVIQKMKYRL